ncbi:hypothetical protein B0H34DRAFT_65395 [Crassisporium funariophilum]|nr:hypothetical protein B0H34DRAFT_65395 [Crassisporium funariophilum]
MPTTRRQTAIEEGKIKPDEGAQPKTKRSPSKTRKGRQTSKARQPKHDEDAEMKEAEADVGEKRDAVTAEADLEDKQDERPKKKTKTKTHAGKDTDDKDDVYKAGTIERGHIYFFYRPRVQLEEAHSIDDIKNFHMLLVPRPPEFASNSQQDENGTDKTDLSKEEESEMKVLAPGADAVPAPDNSNSSKKHFRMITVGKKKLPEPPNSSGGSRRNDNFWATVTTVGDDLQSLEKGLGEKTYETKTRVTRHEAPARLVARGGYAIINSDATTPSKRETHLGYHVSHPTPTDLGDVQESLGIYSASSFIVQVKNPLAPATGPQQAHSKPAEYPEWIMRSVFGAGAGKGHQTRGRESYGLRFASCETPELLDYQGAELLLIAAKDGEEGLESRLGEGRGTALKEIEEREGHEPIRKAFDELGLDLDKFPVESLEGSWI